MLKIILEYLPFLFTAMLSNIVLGTYNNVKTLKKDFSKEKFQDGIYKSFVIAFGFVSLSVVFDKVVRVADLSSLEIMPDILLTSAIVLYMAKGIKSLVNILGVTKVIETPDIVIER